MFSGLSELLNTYLLEWDLVLSTVASITLHRPRTARAYSLPMDSPVLENGHQILAYWFQIIQAR